MKKNILFTFLILLICIFGFTLAYFGITSLGEQEFKTSKFEATTYDTFVSPNNWQPGDEVEKIVNVKNIGNVDMAVRISLEEQWKSTNNEILSNTQNNESIALINLVNTSDWVKEGNYYYYKYRLVKNDTTSNFMNKITFNENIDFNSNCITVNNIKNCSYTIGNYEGATYTLNIKIDTVQFDKYKKVWNTNLTILNDIPSNNG